ncbi:sensor histidine kinase [Brevibacillus sp. SYSU BS000544]|uniref:sensor histidine kinase n=1 Tax=Brevibacillus sp. SYSU BS000544 TaxID=3416443 RepID=UPI003CE44B82
MKLLRLAFLVLTLLIFTISSVASASEKKASNLASNGVFEIGPESLADHQLIALDGEWEFYWNQLLAPSDFEREPLDGWKNYVKVPSEWSALKSNKQTFSNEGYGTYRLQIKRNGFADRTVFALYMPSVATSYQVWIDGEWRGGNGTTGVSASEMVAMNYPKAFVFSSESNTIEIVIQVSNFVQRKGGLWQPIQFGLAEDILFQREKSITVEMFLAGSLFIMGIYHLGLFVLRRKEKSPLYFGLLCMSIGLRTLLLGQTMLLRIFPGIPWDLAVKLEYLTSILGITSLLLFVFNQYPKESNELFKRFYLGIAALFCLMVIFTKPIVFTKALTLLQLIILLSMVSIIWIYILAAIRRRKGSILNGIGIIVFFLTVLNDTLYYQNVGWFENLVPFGLLIFLLTQMINLSYFFSRSFAHVELLSNDLARLNTSLEEKVKIRTEQLEKMNYYLEKVNRDLSTMEESRRRLLSNISHELGTPLTSIQGYLKAMLDEVVPRDDPKYLQLIHAKTVILQRIIRDLYELTKLESGQISFHFREVLLEEFVEQLYEKNAVEIEKKGFRFELQRTISSINNMVPVVKIDPIRIEQVVTNLVMNASKFTPGGGTIRLLFDVQTNTATNGEVIIGVQDNGIGIAEEEMKFIFDRFYKGTGSRKLGSDGVGLGLAISKEIVQCHGGTIEAISKEGEGSTFRFTLPVQFVSITDGKEVS